MAVGSENFLSLLKGPLAYARASARRTRCRLIAYRAPVGLARLAWLRLWHVHLGSSRSGRTTIR
jgi:hypothetical protein